MKLTSNFVFIFRPDLPPNHVLLYTILNPRYPITTVSLINLLPRILFMNFNEAFYSKEVNIHFFPFFFSFSKCHFWRKAVKNHILPIQASNVLRPAIFPWKLLVNSPFKTRIYELPSFVSSHVSQHSETTCLCSMKTKQCNTQFSDTGDAVIVRVIMNNRSRLCYSRTNVYSPLVY